MEDKSHSTSTALLTDLYQLTMANGYWKKGMAEREAVFHLFFRRHPFKGGYTLACGLETVIQILQNFRFDRSDLRYLSSLMGNDEKPLFSSAFLRYLSEMRFSCTVHAMPEGSIVFPHEPVLRIQGPLIQTQILETVLLNIINFQTLIATKAARICKAAKGEPVLEFGLRRAQGIDGALSASRAAYIGGCAATSNVLAGKKHGIPVKGTHAHSWVMAFDTEPDAFNAYADAMPNNCVFLVDTYDTLEGVKHAIDTAKRLRINGHEMVGIRLDSGDLTALSIQARKLLDAGGFPHAQIVASNDLDEYRIQILKKKGAKITVWGVGTRLVTAYDQPALGGVYKLAALKDESGQWQYKIKLSEQSIKVSNPGILQVRRFLGEDGYMGDMIYNEEWENVSHTYESFDGKKMNMEDLDSMDLLQPIFQEGKQVYLPIDIHHTREYANAQLACIKARYKRQEGAAVYPVGLEQQLQALKQELMEGKWKL